MERQHEVAKSTESPKRYIPHPSRRAEGESSAAAQGAALSPEVVRAWLDRLSSVAVSMPFVRRRSVQEPAASCPSCIRRFPVALGRDLGELASRAAVTAGTILEAAMVAVVHRYTAETTVVVVESGGAERVGGDPALLLLRIDLTGSPGFQELVQRVADAHREAAATLLPLSRAAVLEWALSAGAALAGAHFGFRIRPQEGRQASESNLVESNALLPASSLDLAWSWSDGILGVGARFAGAASSRVAMDRMLGHVEATLQAVVQDSLSPIAALPLLTAPELEDLAAWNATALEYDDTVSLVEMVRRQVLADPSAPAIEFEGRTSSYRDVDRRADRLSNYLRERGVVTGTLVALYIQRSMDMIVSVLAVHRAGAAYLPIDPSYPAERIRFMLSDSGAAVILTQETLRDTLPEHDARVVSLDGEWEEIGAASENPLPLEEGPERLAYVIYTSGSTGQPKGVQIEHRNVVNFLAGIRGEIPMVRGDTLVAVTPLSFDISVLEMFLPLTSGAKIVVASRDVAANPRALAELLDSGKATHFQATPSMWQMLVDSGWRGRGRLAGLCGGEALPQPLADTLISHGVELWNLYGPTEATIWATTRRLERAGEPVSIGLPMANVTAHVLDGGLHEVPVGVQGELYLGGRGLARGYLKRPELTAERFIMHEQTGERLYRTGDLARRRENGALEFLGRIDSQVKLRGHRIELGEVEAALVALPEVSSAAAIVREDSPGDQRLVGYVAVGWSTTLGAAELRQALQATLPPYMVPDAFVLLDTLPLNTNGKIDRRRLPRPIAASALPSDANYVGPRTALETKLVSIWEDVLDTSPIGVTDNFFDLHATSLTAARLFGRIERELGTRLPLSPLFRAPTIESLAALIEGGDGKGATQHLTSLVPVQPNGTKPPIFCIHGGAGTILHFEPLARRLGEDQPFYGLQMQGLYGDAYPHLSAESMASHYLREIKTVQPEGPYRIAGYCFGAIVAFEMAQRLMGAGEGVELLASINGPSPMYIRRHGGARRLEPEGAHSEVQPQPQGRAARLLQAVKRLRWSLEWAHIRVRLENAVTRVCAVLHRPIPDGWRERTIYRICRLIERSYEPLSYPGSMLVLRAGDLYREQDLGWRRYVEGAFETFDVPGEHWSQRDAMHEPAVAFVAEKIGAAVAAHGSP